MSAKSLATAGSSSVRLRRSSAKSGTTGFQPPVKRRAFEAIVAHIREGFASGSLKAGDRLPSERQLAQDFVVSRNTVREALRSLENAGLLELRKGATGGAFVRQGNGDAMSAGLDDLARLGFIEPQHVGEARIVIGTAVARLACKRRTSADLRALRENVKESTAYEAAGQSQLRSESNFNFHRLLAKAAKNPVLEVLTDAVLEFNRKLGLITGQPHFGTILLPSRERLLHCLEKRDAEGAAKEMESYLTGLQRFYLSRLGKSSG
jgi:DNA-binding FadR family transcriptional regulator